jgi:hypothetical protein
LDYLVPQVLQVLKGQLVIPVHQVLLVKVQQVPLVQLVRLDW